MPPPGPDGDVDPSAAPDCIAVVAGDSDELGYVRKRFLFPKPTTSTELPHTDPWRVYAEDLRTLIGHMVQGKGFVPLGVDPATIPDFPVEQGPSFAAAPGEPTALTIYVRNAAGQTAWFAVLAGGGFWPGSQGYDSLGVGCIDIGAGGQLVMLDRSPQDPGVKTRQTIYTRGQASELPTLWVDIGADGAVSHGEGVPGWWPDDPQVC